MTCFLGGGKITCLISLAPHLSSFYFALPSVTMFTSRDVIDALFTAHLYMMYGRHGHVAFISIRLAIHVPCLTHLDWFYIIWAVRLLTDPVPILCIMSNVTPTRDRAKLIPSLSSAISLKIHILWRQTWYEFIIPDTSYVITYPDNLNHKTITWPDCWSILIFEHSHETKSFVTVESP